LTESRRQTCESSGAQEDLADDQSKMAVTSVEWRGTRMEYTTYGGLVVWASKPTVGQVYGFGPQNPGGGFEKEWTTRGGIEAKLSHEGRGGHRMKIMSGWTITPSRYVV
jgi:hypothetical protein